MTFYHTDFGYLLILDPGDEVVRCLIQFAREHEIDEAAVSGVGPVSEVELGSSAREREHRRTLVTTALEACSVTGALTLVDGEPYPHLHGSIASEDRSMLAGHVYQAVCSAPFEIAVRTTADDHSSHYRAAAPTGTRTLH